MIDPRAKDARTQKRVDALRLRLAAAVRQEGEVDATIGRLMSRRVGLEERQAEIMSKIEALTGPFARNP